MYGLFCINPLGEKEIMAEYLTEAEALEDMPENYPEFDFTVEFLGKHYAGKNAEADADIFPGIPAWNPLRNLWRRFSPIWRKRWILRNPSLRKL